MSRQGGGGCLEKLDRCYNSQLSCPLAPVGMMGMQDCDNICPTTQVKCDAKFPLTETKCMGLFELVKKVS